MFGCHEIFTFQWGDKIFKLNSTQLDDWLGPQKICHLDPHPLRQDKNNSPFKILNFPLFQHYLLDISSVYLRWRWGHRSWSEFLAWQRGDWGAASWWSLWTSSPPWWRLQDSLPWTSARKTPMRSVPPWWTTVLWQLFRWSCAAKGRAWCRSCRAVRRGGRRQSSSRCPGSGSPGSTSQSAWVTPSGPATGAIRSGSRLTGDSQSVLINTSLAGWEVRPTSLTGGRCAAGRRSSTRSCTAWRRTRRRTPTWPGRRSCWRWWRSSVPGSGRDGGHRARNEIMKMSFLVNISLLMI